MLTVNLHGHLEEKFGTGFKFDAKTVGETISALQANFPEFSHELAKDNRAYHVLVDAEDYADSEKVTHPIKTDSTVDIIPAMEGSGGGLGAIGAIILGAVLIVAAPYAAATLFQGVLAPMGVYGVTASVVAGITSIGWGLALAGVASLLAPDKPDTSRTDSKSTSLQSGENVVGQGMPVPVGYGRLLLGSVVISATYQSNLTLRSYATSYKYNNTIYDAHVDPLVSPQAVADWLKQYGYIDQSIYINLDANDFLQWNLPVLTSLP